MEKQVHFCSRPPGPRRINSRKICGNSTKKEKENRQNRTGNSSKQCGNLPKIVPEIKKNCTRKAHKTVPKKLQNHADISPLWCRKSTGRPYRAAPLSSPKISPIFLKKNNAIIFSDAIISYRPFTVPYLTVPYRPLHFEARATPNDGRAIFM